MAVPDLEAMKEAWEAVARYSVYRTEGYPRKGTEVKTILHADQPLRQARAKAEEAEGLLRNEVAYRPYVMCRPLIAIELENPNEARTAYQLMLRAAQAN
jgi:hypothetical protein